MTRSGFRASLEEILGVPSGSLRDSDSRETIEAWSSLADVKILASMTSELGIEPGAEVMEAETVGELLEILQNQDAFS